MFKGVEKEVYANISIHRILHLIKNESYRAEINELRTHQALFRTRYEKGKTRLLSFTPVGRYYLTRCTENLFSFSKMIVLDFDEVNDVKKAKEKATKLPYTLCCFISPSGKGLKILVKGIFQTTSEYKKMYSLATQVYTKALGYEVDYASDPTRLCFLSSDKELYWNPNSICINY